MIIFLFSTTTSSTSSGAESGSGSGSNPASTLEPTERKVRDIISRLKGIYSIVLSFVKVSICFKLECFAIILKVIEPA